MDELEAVVAAVCDLSRALRDVYRARGANASDPIPEGFPEYD